MATFGSLTLLIALALAAYNLFAGRLALRLGPHDPRSDAAILTGVREFRRPSFCAASRLHSGRWQCTASSPAVSGDGYPSPHAVSGVRGILRVVCLRTRSAHDALPGRK